MLREGHGDLYKAQQRKREESEMLRGEREIRSSLLILDLKDAKLQGSERQGEGKTFRKLHVLGMNDDLWDPHGVKSVILSLWQNEFLSCEI